MNEKTPKRVAIVQSCYLPWKGYFDIINGVDSFVLYDTCQFTRRDWRSRNIIKTPQGLTFLTVPVKSKGNYNAPISAIEIADPKWVDKHLASLRHSYGRAPHFKEVWPHVAGLYDAVREETLLSRINRSLTEGICLLLGVGTPLHDAPEDCVGEDPTERLVGICKLHGATEYVSGLAAKNYLKEQVFKAEGISVRWMQYGPYTEYEQLHPPFSHNVTVLDVLFHTGIEDAGRHVFTLSPQTA
jgi:hypothetical protein